VIRARRLAHGLLATLAALACCRFRDSGRTLRDTEGRAWRLGSLEGRSPSCESGGHLPSVRVGRSSFPVVAPAGAAGGAWTGAFRWYLDGDVVCRDGLQPRPEDRQRHEESCRSLACGTDADCARGPCVRGVCGPSVVAGVRLPLRRAIALCLRGTGADTDQPAQRARLASMRAGCTPEPGMGMDFCPLPARCVP
jgi:hypothetical protein